MKKVIQFLNEEQEKICKKDLFILGFILLFYGIISFINLGSFKNPNTFFRINKGDSIIIQLTEEEDIIKLKTFNGERNARYKVFISNDNNKYSYIKEITGTGALSWDENKILKKGSYLKFIFLENSSIGELALYNNSKELIKIKSIKYNNKKITTLTDEQKLIPSEISYMNSTYFDEIYFARTAYEYVEGIATYEWTHPPLGKLIQAIPIYITKQLTPFNYRLMGNISGIIMIVVMYFFGKLLFKKRKYAILSSLFMCFDTFHFAQTRMGTVDSHLVLFIMLALYFMIKFVMYEKTKDLFFSGIFFSLSIAVKWTGFYGGLALALIYFTYLIKAKKVNLEYFVKGSLFFLFVPTVIYCCLYFIFPNNNLNYTDNFQSIINQQKEMYKYHSTLEDDHFFSSKWYTWPVSYKPVWYHEHIIDNDTKETITGIGNIVIWWFGIIAIIYVFIKMILKKDKISFFLVITIASLFLPYAFIGRVMFLYHYFPVLPFLMLAIVSLLKDFTEKTKLNIIIPIYLLLVISFFIIYYPVISGMPVKTSYIDKLRLLDSWYF